MVAGCQHCIPKATDVNRTELTVKILCFIHPNILDAYFLDSLQKKKIYSSFFDFLCLILYRICD